MTARARPPARGRLLVVATTPKGLGRFALALRVTPLALGMTEGPMAREAHGVAGVLLSVLVVSSGRPCAGVIT